MLSTLMTLLSKQVRKNLTRSSLFICEICHKRMGFLKMENWRMIQTYDSEVLGEHSWKHKKSFSHFITMQCRLSRLDMSSHYLLEMSLLKRISKQDCSFIILSNKLMIFQKLLQARKLKFTQLSICDVTLFFFFSL